MWERMHVTWNLFPKDVFLFPHWHLSPTHKNTNNRQNLLSVNYVLGTMKATY